MRAFLFWLVLFKKNNNGEVPTQHPLQSATPPPPLCAGGPKPPTTHVEDNNPPEWTGRRCAAPLPTTITTGGKHDRRGDVVPYHGNIHTLACASVAAVQQAERSPLLLFPLGYLSFHYLLVVNSSSRLQTLATSFCSHLTLPHCLVKESTIRFIPIFRKFFKIADGVYKLGIIIVRNVLPFFRFEIGK